MIDVEIDPEAYMECYPDESLFEVYMADVRRKMCLAEIDKRSPRRVIEIGCGPVPLSAWLDWETVDVYLGVEMDPDRASVARENAGRGTILTADFLDIHRFIEGFDMVVMNSVLHEVDNPTDFLKSSVSVIHRSGHVVVTVPNPNSFHRGLGVTMGMIEDVTEDDVRNHYTRDRIEEEFRQSGLWVVDYRTEFFKPFSHGVLEPMVRNGTLTDEMIRGMREMDVGTNGAEAIACGLPAPIGKEK